MIKKVWLVLPDLHFPFQDPSYIKVALTILRLLAKEVTGIVQLGDFLDCWQLSNYDKNPDRKNRIIQDIEEYNKFLNRVEVIGNYNLQFYQLEGNHEDRLRRYTWSKAPDLVGMIRDFPEMLRFKERMQTGNMKYKWFPLSDWKACKIGDVTFHHGHYFNKHTAVNNLAIYETKFISGHTHRFQYASNGSRWAVSLGHGALEEDIGHVPTPHGWQQAIGVLTVTNGIGSLEAILVKDGKCNFRGVNIEV